MNSSILEIEEDLKKSLSSYRYNHSINVMKEAIKLAKRYNADIDKCKYCALTHDLAKEFSDEINRSFVKKYNLPKELLDPINKKLIHGYIAAIIVKEKYNFTPDMVLAVKYHTTGYVGMDLLAKIIFLADKIEKGKNYPLIDEERKLAYQDIDKAIIFCLTNQIKHLTSQGKKVNKRSYETLEYLKKITSK